MRGVAAMLAALAALASVRADIPVHCVYDQVVGTWELQLSRSGFDNSIDCSKPFATAKTVRVTLEDPNVASTEHGEKGTWTLVYDEGWELRVAGQRFWAFLAYDQFPNGTVVSHCGQTSNGWYHDDVEAPGVVPKNWGCYQATKVSSRAAVPLETVHQLPTPLLGASAMLDETLGEDAEFAARINAAQSSWQAKASHPFVGSSLRDAAARAGTVRGHRRTVKAQNSAGSSAALRATPKSSIKASLPAAFDWRALNGTSFVGPVRNQGSCGSCYSFAATNSYLSRAMILSHNQETTMYAPESMLACSKYAQACSGGFAYLVSKQGMDFGLVTEDCFPYTSGANGTVPPCSQQCTDPSKRRFIADYGYVGGFYGNCSEEAMMEEIYNYGPIPVSFEVYPDFKHYTGGVYVHTGLQSSSYPWVEVNHAVLAVGWGHDDASGLDYWIIMNSWGTSWGLNGYFLIKRGSDECGIESEAVWNTPVLPKAK